MWGAILLGGGSGSRMGAGRNKVLLPLGGIPVIRRSALALRPHAEVLVVVCPPAERAAFEAALAGLPGSVSYAPGGDTRQASVASGLAALPDGCDHVLVHDGARPLVDAATIRAAMRSAEEKGSGIASVPLIDTVKEADAEGRVLGTPERARLRCVQTPQAFRTELLRAAHERAAADRFLGTDDASLLEHMGLPVWLTPGHPRNLKLTTPEDLTMAEALLPEPALPALRVGTGYDVHRLVEGRPLVLCGVTVPWEKGLLGHSDADVALHALMDAMLGAAALGDIGQHFPDRDPAYKGISSMKLLAHTVRLLAEHGLRVANADLTIAAQAPKLAPYIPAMREQIAGALSLPLDRVSVKATTTEHLGFEGRGEGISAQATVLAQATAPCYNTEQ
ncbi:MAG: 2-C-methyl-D-erythritol 2,4-cyclodiphosphate synthase [Clostridia bacterium]|nr:2-C-methyl-D-erythritol 2,4-cyclodiphosphate synthase [Clostridia bacterium]